MAQLYLNAANSNTEVVGEHVGAIQLLIQKLEMVVYHATEAQIHRPEVSK
jgi:hypothetical protein